MSRRSFLATTGGLAAAAQIEMFGFASSLFASESKTIKKPLIRAAFVRPNVDKYWMGWPGASYDIKGHQRQYTKVLTDAAKKLGVNLELIQAPLHDDSTIGAFLDNLKQSRPDGILIVSMCLNNPSWPHIDHIAKNRLEIPMVVFSPLGTSFTCHFRGTRNIKGVFIGATQDVQWLADGLKLLKVIWQMKNTRICIVAGSETKDRKLDVVGTTLHYIPSSRFGEEFKKVQETDEVRAFADYYAREAKEIVEPTRKDLLNAAKNYFTIRRIMEAENCDGFSMDCLGPISKHGIDPPCLAFSVLRDEGIVASCEADWQAAISSRLTHLLLGRPGFMQDPAPNSVNNTLMAAHCACATKLDGFDKPREPFILRSHNETDIGVATQVLWRIGQKITIMKFKYTGPEIMYLGTGTVLRNNDTRLLAGCRTSVEIEVDDVPDSRDVKGFHQLFIYGDHTRQLKAYAQLAGVTIEHI
jgi:hypothetical protein